MFKFHSTFRLLKFIFNLLNCRFKFIFNFSFLSKSWTFALKLLFYKRFGLTLIIIVDFSSQLCFFVSIYWFICSIFNIEFWQFELITILSQNLEKKMMESDEIDLALAEERSQASSCEVIDKNFWYFSFLPIGIYHI